MRDHATLFAAVDPALKQLRDDPSFANLNQQIELLQLSLKYVRPCPDRHPRPGAERRRNVSVKGT